VTLTALGPASVTPVGRQPAYEIAPGVWRIPVMTDDAINAFAFVADDEQVTLLDGGLPYTRRRVAQGLRHLGSDVSQVTRIIATHAHNDHAGGLAWVARQSGAPVVAHELDVPYLRTGRVPPIGPQTPARGLLERFARYPRVAVTSTVADGERVVGGLQAFHTPGHTPGHTSWLHEPTGTLVTGDAVHFYRGQVRIGIALYCNDVALNERSAARLGELDYDAVGFTHGPEIRRGGRAALRAFLATRSRP
jgi:glyoxylase-like metal-dependent hydrolase (beta-lactamase superfamily II)